MNEIKENDIIKVTVTGITSYGIFVKYNDYTGLIHISEITNSYVHDINNYAMIDDKIFVKVLNVDNESKKLKLSIKGIDYRSKKSIVKTLESKNGFTPLKESLEIWTNEKLKEYQEKETN